MSADDPHNPGYNWPTMRGAITTPEAVQRQRDQLSRFQRHEALKQHIRDTNPAQPEKEEEKCPTQWEGPESIEPLLPDASADTWEECTPKSITETASDAGNAPVSSSTKTEAGASVRAPSSGSTASATVSGSGADLTGSGEVPESGVRGEDSGDAEEIERAEWDQDWREMSLAEILLRKLGIPPPADHPETASKRKLKIDLSPPLTTSKVAAAIATVSIGALEARITPAEANVTLFALQTLLSALRLNLKEQKASEKVSRQEEQRCTTEVTKARSKTTGSSSSRKPKK